MGGLGGWMGGHVLQSDEGPDRKSYKMVIVRVCALKGEVNAR